ncbi:hypothetical protein Pfo_027309 [Paulownia fortunei]|nr:hypothetical protein Pfo_027309 [Paulownia fortunei]
MVCQVWIPFIFIILTNLVTFVTCQYTCETNGNYTSNSTYRANLNTLLSSLASNVAQNGFYNASAGQSPDVANAIVLCRGDVQLETCRICVHNATIDLVQFCPNEKQAVLWREYCMLRYSDEAIFGTLATFPSFWAWNWENATSLEQFKGDVGALLDNLRVQAASSGPVKKIAAGNRTGPDFQTIYALVQCTPDLSPLDCSTCLTGATQDLRRCCDWRRGGGIFRPSCSLRYESFQFYNQTMLQESLLPLPQGKDDNSSTRTVIIIVVPIGGCLILAVAICIFLRKRIKQKAKKNLEIGTVESLQYDFGTIRDATDDFSQANMLGQGGFGAVYKGKLLDGQEIAVKRLSRSSDQGDLEFKNEVLLVARLQHRNLVRLLGFCLKEIERLLIYEFVQNASLDYFMFDPIRRQQMDRDIRYKIIGGIAKGLLYLHEDSRLRIIHRDLKTSNILLDGEMNPKIADFGMARLIVQDETHGSTSKIVGTYGYMPPEYAFQGHFSVKSDVFSFGVMVLEIVSGQKNNNFRNGENVEHLLKNVIDPVLRAGSGFPYDMLRCIHIGLLCVQENTADRPTMASVVVMLNSSSLTLSLPSKPAFFMNGRLEGDISLLEEENPRQLEAGNYSLTSSVISCSLSSVNSLVNS